jgi:hypothetical protein
MPPVRRTRFHIILLEKSVRIITKAAFLLLLLTLASCGGGSLSGSSASSPTSTLSGNWQLTLLQEEPRPETALSVSGFLVETNQTVGGSLQVPAIGGQEKCGGVALVNGTVDGQNVTFSLNEFGTVLNFTGTVSSDHKSMSGDFQGGAGSCFAKPTIGTWNAFLIPPLNGNFTGTINSQYMQLLQGASSAVPVVVSGSITESSNAGASNATLTGTLNATGYPCFSQAMLSGTISGQNVYLGVFDYNGLQIGSLGEPGTVGSNAPATVVLTPNGVSLVDTSQNGLFLGAFTGTQTVGPCPAIGPENQTSDSGSVAFNLQ